ncbi:hypothetical protein SUGI_1012130 [Cryptomeria japonica]|nr:hypothetical protein SUGI_1012130 [Cryptomeria japonica]
MNMEIKQKQSIPSFLHNNERGKEEDEMMSWELIPQHIIDMCLLPLLPIHSVIRFRRVCREWNKLLHSWEFLRPFIVKENSVELMNYCLLNKIVPLPQGVESLVDENGCAVHDVFLWKSSYMLAVLVGYTKTSRWFCLCEFAIDGLLPRWERIQDGTLSLWGKDLEDYEYFVFSKEKMRTLFKIKLSKPSRQLYFKNNGGYNRILVTPEGYRA